MGFGEAIGACLRNYATFRGRARRSEYWWFMLFGFGAAIVAGGVDKAVSPHSAEGPVSGVLALALLLPQLAVTVRRLHDSDRSGWWLLGFVVYFVGALTVSMMVVFGPAGTGTKGPEGEIVPTVLIGGIALYGLWMFVLMLLRGTTGANRYGEDPAAARG